MLTDLKSGYILGANPRKQFIAQFVGIFFGTLAIVPAWYAMVPNKAAWGAIKNPAIVVFDYSSEPGCNKWTCKGAFDFH